jgi:hypothetical protein
VKAMMIILFDIRGVIIIGRVLDRQTSYSEVPIGGSRQAPTRKEEEKAGIV